MYAYLAIMIRVVFDRFIVTHDGEDSAMKIEEGAGDDREYSCLIRVTDGKSANFSTIVSAYPWKLSPNHDLIPSGPAREIGRVSCHIRGIIERIYVHSPKT